MDESRNDFNRASNAEGYLVESATFAKKEVDMLRKALKNIFVVVLLVVASKGYSATVTGIFKQARAKYAKFEKVAKDMVILYEMKAVEKEGEITAETKVLKKGEKFRIETTMEMPELPAGHPMAGKGEMKTIVIHDGKDTYMISPFAGKQKLPEGEGKDRVSATLFWTPSEEDLEEVKLKLVGTDKVGKRDAYIIEAEEEDGSLSKTWIDKNSFVNLKTEDKSPESESVMLCSDFRTLEGGWEIPYKTEVYEDKKLVASIVIKSVKINTGLSDDLFNAGKVEIKTPTGM